VERFQQSADLALFVMQVTEGELELLYVAEPGLLVCSHDSCVQVALDLSQSICLRSG
jgi:hypothetical protein